MVVSTVPDMVGAVVYGVVFFALAVFVFLQRKKSPSLSSLVFVAVGLALWGIFYGISVPFELLEGVLGYGGFASAVRVTKRIITAVGQLGGYGFITIGATLVAAKLAGSEGSALDEPLAE